MKTLSDKSIYEQAYPRDIYKYKQEDVKQFIKDIENAPKKESRIIQTDIGEYDKFVSIHFIKKLAGDKLK